MRTTAGISAAALAAAALTATAPTAVATGNDRSVPAVSRQVDDPRSIARSAVTAVQAHRGVAKVGDGQGFTVTDALVDPSGATHVRMDRTYRGLPVLGGDLVVHRGADGGWRGVSQTLGSAPTFDTTPAVGADAATRAALAPSKANRDVRGAQVAADPTLVVDAVAGGPRLAWQVLSGGVQEDGTPSRLATYVDARTGEVLRAEQEIQTVGGEGDSLYGGTVPLELTLANGTYSLKDPTRGNSFTADMGNKTDSMTCQLFGTKCATGTLFTSSDNLFGNGSTSSRESAAVDAQYGTDKTWDYFKLVHGRNGIFGDGSGSSNRVHYGTNYANAFWDGARMTYGDGDGSNYGPLTSLDVAGHEMSHGVTENTADLTYSGESGGLNESTSDIFGTMVEFYAANPEDPADYLIGEEFDLQTHLGFRRMDQPSSDGASVDCWDSGVGQLDVHYSSGVGNHFYYLLAEGSGSKTIGGVAHSSTTCNGSTVTGIGRDAAAKIWFRGLTVYMTSSTDYAGARTATLNAARDLYGAGSAQYSAVAAAWSAVSVG